MCSPSPPPAPDYTGAANAQGAQNIAAAQTSAQLNRPNQITPWGSQMWYQGPQGAAAPGGSGGPTQGGGAGGPGYQTGWTPGNPGKFFGATGGTTPAPGSSGSYSSTGGYSPANDWTSVTSLSPVEQQLFDQQNAISTSLGSQAQSQLGQVQSAEQNPFSLGGMPGIQYGPQNAQLQTSVGNPGVQSQIDTSGVGPYGQTPTNSPLQQQIDTSNVGKVPGAGDFAGLQQQATDAAMSRQNLQLNQQQEQLSAQLANQGITPGSDAYNRAMQPLQQARVDAQNQAFLTGTQYENQLYGQAANTNQLQFGENQAQGQFANQAAGQQFGQGATAAQLQNQLEAQQFGQAGARGQFANAAAGQQFGQNVTAGQFGNAAQGQQFQQGIQGSQLSNTAQQQAIGQEAYLRELPLNELNALRSGAQVQAPQFPQYNSAQVQPAPTFAATQAQGAYNLQNYANQVGQSNGMLGGLFNLGGSMFGAAGSAGGFSNLFSSDRRLKRNLRRLGRTPRGTPLYSFTYVWGEPAIGVMSDEAPPRAVVRGASGFDMVDYSQV